MAGVTVAFDTLKAATRLQEEAGFDPTKARVLVSTFAEGMAENLATKDDIAGLRRDFKTLATKEELAGLRRDFKMLATKEELAGLPRLQEPPKSSQLCAARCIRSMPTCVAR